jgi:hypothetical protein
MSDFGNDPGPLTRGGLFTEEGSILAPHHAKIMIPKRLGLVYSMACLRSTELMGSGSSSTRMITGQHTSMSSVPGWRPYGTYIAQMARWNSGKTTDAPGQPSPA